ncbi:MAG: hypothetical protein M3Q03_14775 [Chloroflexota bacterium]|nr:hypothetical protein [Chloroflexota bacterium]
MARRDGAFGNELRRGGIELNRTTFIGPTRLNTTGLPLAKVWSAGGGGNGPFRLEWSYPASGEEGAVDDCLAAFVRLHEASVEEIERFAGRWGVLGICAHGLPGTHANCFPLGAAERWWLWSPKRRVQLDAYAAEAAQFRGVRRGWEPLDSWRYWATWFRALLRLAAKLTNGEQTGDADWAAVFSVPPNPLTKSSRDWSSDPPLGLGWATFKEHISQVNQHPLSASYLQGLLGRLVASLLNDVAAVGHDVRFVPGQGFRHGLALGGPSEPGRLEEVLLFHGPASSAFTWPPNNLFATLACQAVVAITSARGPAICSKCGDYYTPTKPHAYRRDRANWCAECRPEASKEQHREKEKERYHAKERQEERLAREQSADTTPEGETSGS